MSRRTATLYRRKFDIAEHYLGGRFGFYRPQGGFFLWLDVGDGERAALTLWREAAHPHPARRLHRTHQSGRRESGPALHPRCAGP